MFSQIQARPQSSTRQAYVCLGCRLNAIRHPSSRAVSAVSRNVLRTFSIHRYRIRGQAYSQIKNRNLKFNDDGLPLANAESTQSWHGHSSAQQKIPPRLQAYPLRATTSASARSLPQVKNEVSYLQVSGQNSKTHSRKIRYLYDTIDESPRKLKKSIQARSRHAALVQQARPNTSDEDEFEDILGRHVVRVGTNEEIANNAMERDALKSWDHETQHTDTGIRGYAGAGSLEAPEDGSREMTRLATHNVFSDLGRPNRQDSEGRQEMKGSQSKIRPYLSSILKRNNTQQSRRGYHVSHKPQQAHAGLSESAPQLPDMPPPIPGDSTGIRAKLRQWQEEHGKTLEEQYNKDMPMPEEMDSELTNTLTKMGDNNSIRSYREEEEDERQAVAHFAASRAEDLDDDITDPRFLFMGDLVELEFANSEKDSLLAVFVRKIGVESQFYSINGRWINAPERQVQYAIPGWVSPKLIEPLLEHLPNVADAEELSALKRESYVNDISVPRHVAAPLVSRMIAFHRESLEIYRKHASTLDRAHEILAHDTDLRYGSLVSAASGLLGIPSDKLPLTALFTVRRALMNAGFAFNVDRRSHRVTGYLQIRPKQQVKTVEQVRKWLREWQDDNATMALMSASQRQRHTRKRGAFIVDNFLKQAREIVLASRQRREPTQHGNVGPSKVRHAITKDQDAVKVESDTRFGVQDHELVRFMEAWACNNMFLGLPRINALPPLILQATGLYEDHDLGAQTGFLFLQELGTILPYENRVRFDQHLLLPSSQHSRPLQQLMNKLLSMGKGYKFSDKMADVRHDWGELPVYCIDDASALEIDDGISVERANSADSNQPEWWVHVHIANPTAFFDRDNPLAKMARHMGETIYTPERAYMMLPRWATNKNFSLAPNRPCLTFSARMNEDGEKLEHKITSGFIRNVQRLTPSELSTLLGQQDESKKAQFDITVGGAVPPQPERRSAVPDMKEVNINELKQLQKLAEGRTRQRKAAGGIFFDSRKPTLSVWQTAAHPGLAWQHPHRKGARSVEGDPVINMQTQGLTNWFAEGEQAQDILVREMMLLACEVSTAWCAERQIPTIYRGSVKKPGQRDPDEFYQSECVPAMERNNGVLPMHIGIEHVRNMGSLVLNTKPLRHNLLGLDHYGKVTSPLRRYGDMILHWQIEAALLKEAHSGTSLVTSGPTLSGKQPDHRFLPFSEENLQTIMTGLQPREAMITRAKSYAENFWVAMLMFRAHHFGEAKLPFDTCHAYIMSRPSPAQPRVMGMFEELSVTSSMMRPEKLGLGFPEARAGDRWECVIESVNVYYRHIALRPIRLADRWE